MKVAIAAIKGSYSDVAAARLCEACAVIEANDFEAACQMVAQALADFAAMPLKNKITGDIVAACSAVETHRLRKLDECRISVNHVVAGTPGSSMSALREIVSHPEALKQCDKFLKKNRNLAARAARDTATAVRDVIAANDPHVAAITGRHAAEIYGASVICEEVADVKDNWTSFGLFARRKSSLY